MKKKVINVLAIGSHPDDIEFGCGGTLHRFKTQGHRTYMLIMSDGSEGGEVDVRKHEALDAAQTLGVEEVFWGGFTDTRLPFYENVITEIEKIVSKTKPTFVLVHHARDTHQDHRHVATCTVAATRNVANVLFYEGPTSFSFEPNVFVDIGRSLKYKFAGLSSHKSQILRTNVKSQTILDIAKATAMFRGTQCRIHYAEAFCSLRMMILP
jgi:LmbE family N-acetylglucosaminyl deacetylase